MKLTAAQQTTWRAKAVPRCPCSCVNSVFGSRHFELAKSTCLNSDLVFVTTPSLGKTGATERVRERWWGKEEGEREGGRESKEKGTILWHNTGSGSVGFLLHPKSVNLAPISFLLYIFYIDPIKYVTWASQLSLWDFLFYGLWLAGWPEVYWGDYHCIKVILHLTHFSLAQNFF